jgi:ATP-dependent DNA ligase
MVSRPWKNFFVQLHSLVCSSVVLAAGPLNALAAFIDPCQLIVAKQLPTRGAWAHDLKHDGYRLHVHVREGAARLIPL